MSPLGTFMIALGGSIGGGIIFLVLGTALEIAGPGILVAWIAGGVLSLGIALNYSELATSLPIVGGGYSFLKEGIGGVLAFLVGFFMLIGNIGFCAFNAFGFVVTLKIFFPGLGLGESTLVAIGVVVFFFVLATRFGSGSPRFQSRLGILLLSVFVVFIVLGLALAPVTNAGSFDPSRLTGPIEAIPVVRMVAFLFASFVSFEFLYGFESLITLYNKVDRPEKNIPRANILAVLVSLVLYLLVTTVVLVNTSNYAGSQNILSVTLGSVLGPAGSYFMAVAAAIACLTSLFASMVNSSRIVYALSRDNYLPGFFKKINDRTGLPHRALLLTIMAVVAFLLVGQIDWALQLADFGFLIGLAFINITVIVLRHRRKELDRPFKTVLYPVLPILSAAFCIFLATQLPPLAVSLGLTVGLTGLIIYALKIARRQDLTLFLGGMKLFAVFGCIIFLGMTEVRYQPFVGTERVLQQMTLVVILIAMVVALFTFFFDMVPVSRIYRWKKEKSEEVVLQAGDMKIFSFSDEEVKAINRANHSLGAIQIAIAIMLSFIMALLANGQIVVEAFHIKGLEGASPEFIQYSLIILVGMFTATSWIGGFTGLYLEWERHAVKAY
ncbi:MAG: APC family permease [Promethearchaeota archaeon]